MPSDEAQFVEEFMGRQLPAAFHHPTFSPEEKDRAKRASDIINEARRDLDWDSLKRCWIAIRLSDGGSDMVIYDDKRSAVRYQLHEQQCAYIAFRNLIGGTTEGDMLRYLRFVQMAYDNGMRLPDPDALDGGPDLAPTSGQMDYLSGRVRGQR